MFQRAINRNQKLIKIIGFSYKVISSQPNAVNSLPKIRLSSKNDNLYRGIIFRNKLKDLFTVHNFHIQIKQQNIIIHVLDCLNSKASIINSINRKVFIQKLFFQKITKGFVIVTDQYFGIFCHIYLIKNSSRQIFIWNKILIFIYQ